MSSRSRALVVSALVLAAGGTALVLMTAGSSPRVHARADAGAQSEAASTLEDKPIAAWRTELLELAFQSASKIPVAPHIKDRSRAQAAVVDTCLQLEQPTRAARYIEQIDNWHRGECYANVAFWCAQHGRTSEVQHYLDLAEQVSENMAKYTSQFESDQSWRRDRIRAAIAKTHVYLGQTQAAAKFEAGLEGAEMGPVAVAKAAQVEVGGFDDQLKAIDAVVAKGDFDQVKVALEGCAQLFNRFYDDESKRSAAEEKIKTSWSKLPVQVRIELTMELAGFALEHKDQAKALELVTAGQEILHKEKWLPEHQVPLMAKLATLQSRAGDKAGARTQADAALAVFDAGRDKIVNIYRAGALRPLAEAYASMGDSTAALAAYARAVEEGTENQNSRPRAEDLSATCSSMAEQELEPDAALRARLTKVQDGLVQPW